MINHWSQSTLFGRICSCKSLTTTADMWVHGGDSSFSSSTRWKLAAAIAKGRQILKPSASNANYKITQQKREENCKSESRAISTIIWYSGVTITFRNIIVLIPLHAILQIIQASCHEQWVLYYNMIWPMIPVTCKLCIWPMIIMY